MGLTFDVRAQEPKAGESSSVCLPTVRFELHQRLSRREKLERMVGMRFHLPARMFCYVGTRNRRFKNGGYDIFFTTFGSVLQWYSYVMSGDFYWISDPRNEHDYFRFKFDTEKDKERILCGVFGMLILLCLCWGMTNWQWLWIEPWLPWFWSHQHLIKVWVQILGILPTLANPYDVSYTLGSILRIDN